MAPEPSPPQTADATRQAGTQNVAVVLYPRRDAGSPVPKVAELRILSRQLQQVRRGLERFPDTRLHSIYEKCFQGQVLDVRDPGYGPLLQNLWLATSPQISVRMIRQRPQRQGTHWSRDHLLASVSSRPRRSNH